MGKEVHEGPLTEPTLLIMLSLADMPRHGYAILKEIEQLSRGRVTMSTGTLYGAVRRLLEARWIRKAADPEKNQSRRERQTYDLTRRGRRVLAAEVERLEALASASRQRLRKGEV
jgi:DNA-binding PadR family transcriptional regulator